MREVVIRVWCDACNREGRTNEALESAQTITVGRQTRQLDLCEDHVSQYVSPLLELMLQHGVKPADGGEPEPKAAKAPKEPKAEGYYPCLLCQEMPRSNYLFVQHIKTAHNDMIPSKMFGTTCPVCGEVFASGAGMGAHIARNHADYGSTTAEVFATAKQQGDPHRVVAYQERALTSQSEQELAELADEEKFDEKPKPTKPKPAAKKKAATKK